MGKDQKVLFNSTIFGPVKSRRLGVSLGINLMPNDGKVCSFDCVYCEAGYNSQGKGTTGLPSAEKVSGDLQTTLQKMKQEGESLDVITFSGNGEPTLHPEFGEIVEATIRLRNEYYPEAKVSVLSNSTRIHDQKVFDALLLIDNNILKLDSAIEETMRRIDQPTSKEFTVEKVVEQLKRFGPQCTIQTMLLRGSHNGVEIDNTTDEEIDALIKAYKEINPKEVMLYSLDRSTPEENLTKVSHEEIECIAAKVAEAGVKVSGF